MNPTLKLAAVLSALAHHLTAHPDLPLFTPHRTASPGVAARLQLVSYTDESPDGASGLLAWAQTLTSPRVTWAVMSSGDVYVSVHGALGDGTVIQVWDDVPELALPEGAALVQGPVSLDTLRAITNREVTA